MAEYISHSLILHLIIFQGVLLLIVLGNTRRIHRAMEHVPPAVLPMVSVLIPARNEEMNIAACLQSLLQQDYPSYEILVYDDHSNDSTASILDDISRERSRVRVFHGGLLPEGWLGKNHACAWLAGQARGELLLFTDADTTHAPHMLRTLVTALCGENADMLTGFPRQKMQTWGERLLVPFFSWAALCFTPLGLAYSLRLPALSTAVGQVMLFRREAYRVIGGHAAIKALITDDLLLARRIKSAGLRWRVAKLTDLVSCRMYINGRAAFDAFSCNLFAAFDFALLRFLFAFAWLGVVFWVPLILLVLSLAGFAPLVHLDVLAFCIGLSLLLWLIPGLELGNPAGMAFLYPFIILATEITALRSLGFHLSGRQQWKDRSINRSPWKWF